MSLPRDDVSNVYNSTSWTSYNTYRPGYPRSLWSLITSYHAENGGSFETVHDVGAGAGQAASALARYFSTVCVSDPSEHNIDTARERLLSVRSEGNADFRFAVAAGSDDPTVSGFIETGTLDLVITCEALHWMDSDAVLSNAAKTLKPGGTFAAVYYGAKPYIPDQTTASQALDKVTELLMERKMLNPVVKKGRFQSATGLHFVGFDEDSRDWKTGVKRIYINTSPSPDDVWKHFTFNEQAEIARSRVVDTDRTEVMEDESSWSKEVGGDWVREYFDSLAPQSGGYTYTDEEQHLLDALSNAVEDGKVKVVWPVHVVLATRA